MSGMECFCSESLGIHRRAKCGSAETMARNQCVTIESLGCLLLDGFPIGHRVGDAVNRSEISNQRIGVEPMKVGFRKGYPEGRKHLSFHLSEHLDFAFMARFISGDDHSFLPVGISEVRGVEISAVRNGFSDEI